MGSLPYWAAEPKTGSQWNTTGGVLGSFGPTYEIYESRNVSPKNTEAYELPKSVENDDSNWDIQKNNSKSIWPGLFSKQVIETGERL